MKIELAVGQRWREVDPRFLRVIQIMAINRDGTVSTRTVYGDGSISTREYRPRAARFHGMRGGYVLTDNDARSVDGTNTVKP